MDPFKSRLDARLRKRARELSGLTSLLRSELPPECDGHYQVANIRDRTVVIMTDSPVWTTRLRQLGPRVLAILQSSGRKNLLHIRVFSRPARPPAATPVQAQTTGSQQISRQSSELITQAASFIEDDELRSALLKLAKHSADRRKPVKES